MSEAGMAKTTITSEVTAIGFWLPLPPKELSPNARVHWAAKARAVKKYRSDAWLCAAGSCAPNKAPKWVRATMQATFNFHRNGRRDKDNFAAMLKPVADALMDAGVIVDDCGLSHDAIEFTVDKSQPAGVTIFVNKA